MTTVEELAEPKEEEMNIDLASLLMGAEPSWHPEQMMFFGSETRSLLLTDEITPKTSMPLCSQIKQLAKESSDPIKLYIHSPGGDIYDGFHIFDTLKSVDAPIITIVLGQAASCGLLIASAGDIRMCHETSTFFYHQPIFNGFTSSSPEEMQSLNGHYAWAKSKYDELMRSQVKLSPTQWKTHFGNSTSKYFDAQQALEYKFVHYVIPRAKKRKISLQEALDALKS